MTGTEEGVSTGEGGKGREPGTIEARIRELREWIAANYEKLLDEAKESLLSEPEYRMSIIFERVKREAMIKHPILPSMAKGLAESALAPYYDRIMAEMKEWAANEERKQHATLRVESQRMSIGKTVLKALEGSEGKPVERRVFKEALVKANLSDADAEKTIREMFREGMIYESKPGFIRRLGA